jgi:molybdopterin converting factor small subunit|tara:strand:+ start:1415 stop:1636 length:222 start_codon:yes stop_codon:yes gene_type:complete
MVIVIKNGGEEAAVNVPNGASVGSIRDQHDELEEVGAPSSYTFAVNGTSAGDSTALKSGDVVTFRPKTSEKGA